MNVQLQSSTSGANTPPWKHRSSLTTFQRERALPPTSDTAIRQDFVALGSALAYGK